jgi:hypothetical protein
MSNDFDQFMAEVNERQKAAPPAVAARAGARRARRDLDSGSSP